MKKLLIFLFCLLALSFTLSAETLSYTELERGLNEDFLGTIEREGPSFAALTAAQKAKMYEDNKVPLTGPLLLNLFVGFGTGSFVQRDTLNGAILAVLDGLCVTGLVAGGIMVIVDVFVLVAKGTANAIAGQETKGEISNLTKGLLIGSASALLASRIYGIIAPIVKASTANGRLNAALYPSLTANGNTVLVASASVRF